MSTPSITAQESIDQASNSGEREVSSHTQAAYAYLCLLKGCEVSSEDHPSHVKKEDNASHEESLSLYDFMFLCELKGLSVRQDSFLNRAAALKGNSQAQQELLAEQKAIKYKDVPDTATPGQIKDIEVQNETVDAQRAFLQNSVVSLRQNASVAMAEINSEVNGLSQKGAQISAYLHSLNEVLESINSMLKR